MPWGVDKLKVSEGMLAPPRLSLFFSVLFCLYSKTTYSIHIR